MKARKQKLVEAADLEAAKELFGTDGKDGLTQLNPQLPNLTLNYPT
jgi:hypothetical protein